jgi:hypothetical protein
MVKVNMPTEQLGWVSTGAAFSEEAELKHDGQPTIRCRGIGNKVDKDLLQPTRNLLEWHDQTNCSACNCELGT